MSRIRTKEEGNLSGSIHRKFSLFGTDYFIDRNYVTRRSYCSDDLGRHVGHGFFLQKEDNQLQPLNGTWYADPNNHNDFFNAYNGVPIYGTQASGYPSPAIGHGDSQFPSVNSRATHLLATTNPNRSGNQWLDSALGLKELPKLLNVAGKNAIQNFARANLSYQFGIKPLFDDLKRLLDWQSGVAKRVDELHRLYSNGGLRRNHSFGQNSIDNADSTHFDTEANFLTFNVSSKTVEKSWGTVRWLPTTLPPKTDKEMLALATKSYFGLNAVGVEAWNAIPWSWLIDWCSTAGDFIGSYQNAIPCSPDGIWIMTQTTTTASFTPTHGFSEIKGGSGTITLTTKERVQGSAVLEANLPFLSAGQMSILGSLLALRF